MRRQMILSALMALGSMSLASAADPPELVNYQGVLRNSMDVPLDGSFAMTFRFFDALAGGNEILVDTHGAVTVSNGLFNVELGSGSVADGSGPGTFTTLADVFAQHTDLYLEVEVGGETLSPRTPVAAAGYALNARRVRGEEIVSGDLELFVNNAVGGCGGGGCSDDNDGLTLGTAKATIQGAVHAIPPILTGDATVNIQPGTYNERVFIERRMITGDKLDRWLTTEATSPDHFGSIVLLGDETTPGNVVLDGSGLPAADFQDGITVLHWLTEIAGLRVTGFTGGGEAAGIRGWGNSATIIHHCEVDANDRGIAADDAAFVEIADTVITGNTVYGISTAIAGTVDANEGTSVDDDLFAQEKSFIHFRGPCTISDGITASCNGYSAITDHCECDDEGGGSLSITCDPGAIGNGPCCTDPTACP